MELKKLIKSLIIRFIVVAIFVAAGIAITTNAIVTNEVALGQLNGGNEMYLALEAYNKYKTIVPFIGTVIVAWAIYPLIKRIFNKIKEMKETKENNNEKDN